MPSYHLQKNGAETGETPSVDRSAENRLPALTPERQQSLVKALAAIKPILPVAVITTNGYSNTEYANALAELFNRAGIEPSRGTQIANGPDETGIMIAAKQPNNLPPAAAGVLEIFKANGLNPKVVPLPARIGADFTIFIGPAPL